MSGNFSIYFYNNTINVKQGVNEPLYSNLIYVSIYRQNSLRNLDKK